MNDNWMDFFEDVQIKTDGLIEYLGTNIKSMYKMFDRGHDEKHFCEVTKLIIDLYKNELINYYDFVVLLTGAAYHDTGRAIDNYEHEKYSAIIFNRDKSIERMGLFTDDEKKAITNIILHHRKKYTAENGLELIMKDADHMSWLDKRRGISRVIYYQIDNFDEIYKENPDEYKGLRYMDQLIKMVRKQITRKPIHFIPQSKFVKELYSEISHEYTDKEIEEYVKDCLSQSTFHSQIDKWSKWMLN